MLNKYVTVWLKYLYKKQQIAEVKRLHYEIWVIHSQVKNQCCSYSVIFMCRYFREHILRNWSMDPTQADPTQHDPWLDLTHIELCAQFSMRKITKRRLNLDMPAHVSYRIRLRPCQ